ncbi:MAG TPA: ubiquinol oxidase subunit II [Candidatus Saccharimonadales bacterium]|nr:ubiquinol oxidase subunit II [Candidatus Saccharimonadales bacterium]
MIVLLVVVAVVVGWYISQHNLPILQPSGTVAGQEKTLLVTIFVLMLIVALPVFGLTIFIVWRYHETNTKAKYTPDYDSNPVAELVWWGIPIILISAIATLTWVSSFKLDPYRSLAPGTEPLKVQVVSLDWKWLFIYPEYDVASVNFAAIPVDRPVEFNITSDSVMNSFWVPALGSQMYTMPGMKTKLNLMATRAGNYYGSSANISGSGFASMHFTVAAMSESELDHWFSNIANNYDKPLNPVSYARLAKPGIPKSQTVYSSVSPGLFDGIIMHYMMPDMTVRPTVESTKPAAKQPVMNMSPGHMDMSMPMGGHHD